MALPATAHFSVREVLDASEPASESYVARYRPQVARTLETLEQVRALLGHRPITMTSLVRTPEENREEGGSETSGHLDGSAADVKVAGLTPNQAAEILEPHVRALGIDQLIVYNGHLHVGTGAKLRGQILDKRSGTLRPWVRGAIVVPPISPDATRVSPMNGQLPTPTPKNTRAWVIGAIIAALGGVLAWLKSGAGVP